MKRYRKFLPHRRAPRCNTQTPKAAGTASQIFAVSTIVTPRRAGWSCSALTTSGESDAALAPDMLCNFSISDLTFKSPQKCYLEPAS